MNSWSESY